LQAVSCARGNQNTLYQKSHVMGQKRSGMSKPEINKCLYPIFLSCIILGLFIFSFLSTAFSNQEGVTKQYKKAVQKMDRAGQVNAETQVPKNIVRVLDEDQGGHFFTEARKSEIKRFRCSSCHNDKMVSIQGAADLSHADIKVVHGGKEKPLSCNTCHSTEDRDFLTTGKDTRIDPDHVYQMCGQCHFRQKKDWIGGAHGKRIIFWSGERVVMNCTSCHNPHSPRFAERWPKTYSVPLK